MKFHIKVPERFERLPNIEDVSEYNHEHNIRYFVELEISKDDDGLTIELFSNYATFGNLWNEDFTAKERKEIRDKINRFYAVNPAFREYVKKHNGVRLLHKAMQYYLNVRRYPKDTIIQLVPGGDIGLGDLGHSRLVQYYKHLGFEDISPTLMVSTIGKVYEKTRKN